MFEMEKVSGGGKDGIGRGSDINSKFLVEAFSKEFPGVELKC